jgi:hypothetical protein
MRRYPVIRLVLIGLLVPVTVGTASSSVVVTNPAPAVTATMAPVSVGECVTWNVSGKLKPSYRGFGSQVRLVCSEPDVLANGGPPTVSFPQCDGPCPAFADACGNFSFNATVCGGGGQINSGNVCFFVVHLDGTSSPSACNKTPPPDAFPQDPNGTTPCSGGLCPEAP